MVSNIKQIDNNKFERILIKTHKIDFGENVQDIINQYVKPLYQQGDILAISEKVVSVCQNNVRHISNVKVSFLAKLITKFVKKYPNDIGFSLPAKMQVAIDITGYPRMILAIIIGGILKILGKPGYFWKIAGNRVSEIDGFNPDAMYPYTEYAILPPKNPQTICNTVEINLNIQTIIIDGNNINTEIIAKSNSVKPSDSLLREILLDNPMGQDNEMTPFVLIRKI
jgi:hypothetical protein